MKDDETEKIFKSAENQVWLATVQIIWSVCIMSVQINICIISLLRIIEIINEDMFLLFFCVGNIIISLPSIILSLIISKKDIKRISNRRKPFKNSKSFIKKNNIILRMKLSEHILRILLGISSLFANTIYIYNMSFIGWPGVIVALFFILWQTTLLVKNIFDMKMDNYIGDCIEVLRILILKSHELNTIKKDSEINKIEISKNLLYKDLKRFLDENKKIKKIWGKQMKMEKYRARKIDEEILLKNSNSIIIFPTNDQSDDCNSYKCFVGDISVSSSRNSKEEPPRTTSKLNLSITSARKIAKKLLLDTLPPHEDHSIKLSNSVKSVNLLKNSNEKFDNTILKNTSHNDKFIYEKNRSKKDWIIEVLNTISRILDIPEEYKSLEIFLVYSSFEIELRKKLYKNGYLLVVANLLGIIIGCFAVTTFIISPETLMPIFSIISNISSVVLFSIFSLRYFLLRKIRKIQYKLYNSFENVLYDPMGYLSPLYLSCILKGSILPSSKSYLLGDKMEFLLSERQNHAFIDLENRNTFSSEEEFYREIYLQENHDEYQKLIKAVMEMTQEHFGPA
jgi:hypothetical protein